jgi:hypothetical protein
MYCNICRCRFRFRPKNVKDDRLKTQLQSHWTVFKQILYTVTSVTARDSNRNVGCLTITNQS